MGFGFNDDGEEEVDEGPKEIPHSYFDSLRWQDWGTLRCGQAVKSVLTGVSGVITNINEDYQLIEIDWDNGKHSRASKSDLTKVIVI